MIKRLQVEHCGEVMKLLTDVVNKMQSEGKTNWNDAYPNLPTIETDIRSNNAFGYWYDSKLSAYITIDEEEDPQFEDIRWINPSGKALIIHRLMVHPHVQGRGIAKACMHFAEEYAIRRSCISLRLDTLVSDKATCTLYESLGYQRLGIITRVEWGSFFCYEKIL